MDYTMKKKEEDDACGEQHHISHNDLDRGVCHDYAIIFINMELLLQL